MFTYTHIRKSLKKNNFISAGFPKNHSFVRRPLGLLCIVIKTGSRVLASVMLIGSCHLMLSAQLIIFNRPINSLSIIFKCCLSWASPPHSTGHERGFLVQNIGDSLVFKIGEDTSSQRSSTKKYLTFSVRQGFQSRHFYKACAAFTLEPRH